VWIAIIGCMIHLVLSGGKDIDGPIRKVEFDTLIFFASLFVLMRALEELGLITYIGQQTSDLVRLVPPGKLRLTTAVLLLMWISALVGAMIDSIPYAAAMVPIVYTLARDDLGLPLTPLVYALVFGTCFGGNGTLIGASANVVACGIAAQNRVFISFNDFFKVGFPFTMVSMVLSTIYMMIFHVLIPWY